MDQDSMVIDRLEAGRLLIDELRRSSFEVASAFWMKPSEENKWYLYIVTPEVDSQGHAAAYRIVYTAIRRMPELGIDVFEVHVIGPSDSLALAANLAAQQMLSGSSNPSIRKPFSRVSRLSNSTLGGIYVDGVYIYPPLQEVTKA